MSAPGVNGGGVDASEPVPEVPEQPGSPAPSFEVVGAHVSRMAAVPTLSFDLEVEDPSGLPVFTISLSTQIAIEPAQRRYDPETRERLTELLGEPGRIGAPTTTMPWTRVDVLVQPFTGHTSVQIPVVCNYDLEIAATNYFRSVADGEVPLVFHFNGSVYYEGDGGKLQIVQIPWEKSSNFRMPIDVWEEMISIHYPLRGWVPASSDTIDRLRRYKLEEGLPSYDAALERLLQK